MEYLTAEADARRVLQEVRESPDDYPSYDPLLSEKAISIAYTYLACGLSLVESSATEDTQTGVWALEKAGKILSDVFQFSNDDSDEANCNLLLAGMALYAAKQFSRAFFVLKDINQSFSLGIMITCFVKKDFASLIRTSTDCFFSAPQKDADSSQIDQWLIEHEVARCFLVVSNFIYSGDHNEFNQIQTLLDKLILLASSNNLTLQWLIVSLLAVIFRTFQASSPWTILPPLLPAKIMQKKYIRMLCSLRNRVCEIWPSQVSALPLALGNNNGAVINLRTSAGKTRVAEIAILKALSTHLSSKVLYLAPFRSLAFELEQSLSLTLIPLGFSVSQLYGGSTASTTDFDVIQQTDVIIATPEKAKALIRGGSGLEHEIRLIIVDEGHLLGADTRHVRNEIFLSYLYEFSRRHDIRVLLLSAVLPNAEDLAQWIAGDASNVARSDWKPARERLGLLIWTGQQVRLEWQSEGNPFNPRFIVPQNLGIPGRKKTFPHDKNEAIAATAVRLASNGTVMIFCARAVSIKGQAEKVLLALGRSPEDFNWDPCFWNTFESVCLEELPKDDIVLKAARKGVICHCDRLPTLVRIAIEKLMRSRPPLIIVATSTLAQGVNIGISSVIVASVYQGKTPMNGRDFWNVCGRAGRAFSDAEGKVLYALDESRTQDQWHRNKNRNIAQQFFSGHRTESVQSGLYFALRRIFEVAQNANISAQSLIEIIANDAIKISLDSNEAEWIDWVFDHIDDELLAMHEAFSTNDESIEWLDDVFRSMLASIQAEEREKNQLLHLLEARLCGLLRRIPSRSQRQKLSETGVPLQVSECILRDMALFHELANSYILSATFDDEFMALCALVRSIETWVFENTINLTPVNVDQIDIEQLRTQWLQGVPLAEICVSDSNEFKIIKKFYGFTLPWIIHGLARIFDSETEQEIVNTYDSVAKRVELGLPNDDACNIFLAGIRSRIAAIRLSENDMFHGKGIHDIKKTIQQLNVISDDVPIEVLPWLAQLSEAEHNQKPKRLTFPPFKFQRDGLPDKLFLRRGNDACYFMSSDGTLYEEVASTDELPFESIANIPGLHFKHTKDVWVLASRNPFIRILEV